MIVEQQNTGRFRVVLEPGETIELHMASGTLSHWSSDWAMVLTAKDTPVVKAEVRSAQAAQQAYNEAVTRYGRSTGQLT